MLHRTGILLLSLFTASLLWSSCSKTLSSDAPLPVSYSPSVIVGSDNQVWYAFDPISGSKHWEFSTPIITGFIPQDFAPSALLYNEMLYIPTINSDTIYKVNAKTGALVKKINLYGVPGFFTVAATPVADANLIYLATLNDTLYAFDTGTSNIVWKFGAGSPIVSSPTIYNGNVYIATTGGRVFSIDKTNGPATGNIPNWEYPSSDSASSAQFVSSPSISAPYLYVGSISDSNMYCIYLNASSTALVSAAGITNGYDRWIYKTQGGIYSSPATLDAKCIFGCNDFKIYCLDTSLNPITGSTVPQAYWIATTSSQVWSSPIVYNQVVYIGSHDYKLYSINLIDGNIKWEFHTNGLIKSSPLAYGSNIYIGSYDKNLYAVDTAHGTLMWSQNITGTIECSPLIDDLTGSNFGKGWNSQISGLVN